MRATFSITTDLAGQKEDPARLIPAFAAAGFDAVHWCHDWTGEAVFYSRAYGTEIGKLAAEHGLRVADVHGFGGTGGTGVTFTEELFAAINLNRAEFAVRAGATALVLHLPPRPVPDPRRAAASAAEAVRALLPGCQTLGVRLAVENLAHPAHRPTFFDALFAEFAPEELGFCYDSGHALITGRADLLTRYADRLLVTHLHDNDGTEDQHRLPGEGKVDWPAVLGAIRSSGTKGTVNLEVRLPDGADLDVFCRQAHGRIRALWEAAGAAAR